MKKQNLRNFDLAEFLGTLILIFATLFLFGATVALAQTSKTGFEIEATNKKIVESISRGDSQATANHYAENAKMLPPNGEIVSGRTNIQAVWKGIMDAGIKRVELKTDEFEKAGNTAYEVGSYTLYDGNGAAVDNGKYVVIWKKSGKNWMLYRDIWNSNRAAK